jgi:hypothetical protein
MRKIGVNEIVYAALIDEYTGEDGSLYIWKN